MGKGLNTPQSLCAYDPSGKNAPIICMAVCSYLSADSLPEKFSPIPLSKEVFPIIVPLLILISDCNDKFTYFLLLFLHHCIGSSLRARPLPVMLTTTSSELNTVAVTLIGNKCMRVSDVVASDGGLRKKFFNGDEGWAFPVFQITQVNCPVNYVSYESNTLFSLSTIFNWACPTSQAPGEALMILRQIWDITWVLMGLTWRETTYSLVVFPCLLLREIPIVIL